MEQDGRKEEQEVFWRQKLAWVMRDHCLTVVTNKNLCTKVRIFCLIVWFLVIGNNNNVIYSMIVQLPPNQQLRPQTHVYPNNFGRSLFQFFPHAIYAFLRWSLLRLQKEDNLLGQLHKEDWILKKTSFATAPIFRALGVWLKRTYMKSKLAQIY